MKKQFPLSIQIYEIPKNHYINEYEKKMVSSTSDLQYCLSLCTLLHAKRDQHIYRSTYTNIVS